MTVDKHFFPASYDRAMVSVIAHVGYLALCALVGLPITITINPLYNQTKYSVVIFANNGYLTF